MRNFKARRLVEFADTDMAGIAHFTSFLRYMEEVEHAFLRACGLSAVLDDEKGKLGFPKLGVSCDYRQPIRFEQLLDIDVQVAWDGKSVTYDVAFLHEGRLVAHGQLRTAFCRFPPHASPYPVPISEWVLARLEQYNLETVNL